MYSIHYFIKGILRDNTHMTSKKIVQLSRPPPPLSIYVQNAATRLTLDVQFQTVSNEVLPHCALRLMEAFWLVETFISECLTRSFVICTVYEAGLTLNDLYNATCMIQLV